MYKLLTLFLFLFGIKTMSQTTYPNLILGYEQKSRVSFENYQQKKIYRTYSSLSQAQMNTPENLITSILSATDQQWYNATIWQGEHNTKSQPQEYFDRIKNSSKEEMYLTLEHQLSFELNGIPTCIIKFYFHFKDEEPLSGAYVFQKRGERWYRTSNPSTSGLNIIVMRLKTEVLEDIVKGESQNPQVQKLIKLIYVNNTLNFSKLQKEFNSWYFPREQKNLLNTYIDKNAW